MRSELSLGDAHLQRWARGDLLEGSEGYRDVPAEKGADCERMRASLTTFCMVGSISVQGCRAPLCRHNACVQVQ